MTSIAATMKEDVADGQKKMLTLIENVGVARSMIPEKVFSFVYLYMYLFQRHIYWRTSQKALTF